MSEKTTTHPNMATALAAAQAEMRNPARNATNPHFRSRYADLAAVRDATIPVLAKHGIATIQEIGSDNGIVTCRVVLLFGEEVYQTAWASAKPRKDDPQAVGSVVTYLRRYTLAAVAGVAPEDDDDGNVGSIGSGSERRTKGRQGTNPEVAAVFAEAIEAAQDQAGLDNLRTEITEKVPAGEARGELARAWGERAAALRGGGAQ